MERMDSKLQLQPQHFFWQNAIYVDGAGTAVMGSIYELWCHNDQGQRNLAYNLNTTYHTTYKVHTY